MNIDKEELDNEFTINIQDPWLCCPIGMLINQKN